VVKALSNFHASPSVPLFWHADALDIIGHMTWQVEEVHKRTVIPEEDRVFWRRYIEAQSRFRYPLLPWHGGGVRARIEAFMESEEQRFIDYINQHTQEFSTILAPLQRHPNFPAGKLKRLWFERLWELCFLPGAIIPFCVATARYWQQIHTIIGKEKQRRNYFCNKVIPLIRSNQSIPEPYKAFKEQEVDIITRVLDEERHRVPLVTWRDHLGIDKKSNIAKQKHYLWSIIFKELVDMLRPYCRGPKHSYLKDAPTPRNPTEVLQS
jgi:hypothetical protein